MHRSSIMAKTLPLRVDNEATGRWTLPTGARIIVVDDDGEMREQIAIRLRLEGYRIYSTMTEAELVRVLATRALDGAQRFADADLFVLDWRVSHPNDLVVLRQLRIAAPLPCIILITSWPAADVVREAADLRIEILTRPFTLDHLADAVMLTLLSRFAAV